MIIRSQNKEALININNIGSITIGEIYGRYLIAAFNGGNEKFLCGKYSTKEKAMKVLDMIQEEYQKYFYNEGGFMGLGDGYVQAFGFIPPKVFQMPQDSDVTT